MTLRAVYPLGVRYMLSNKMKSLPMRVGQNVPSGFIRTNNYLQFDGVASYGQFERDIVIPAGDDFEISVDVLWDGKPWVGILGESKDLTYVRMTNSQTIDVRTTGGGGVFSPLLPVGQMVTITLTRLGLDLTLDIDGTSDTLLLSSSGEIKVGFIGLRRTDSFDGIIANPYIKNLTTGQVLVDSYIDQKGSDTQTNRADQTNNLQLFNVDHGTDWFTRWENGDYVPSRFPYLIEMQTAAGLADYSYNADRYWTFGEPMGTSDERPAVTLDEETTVRLYTDDYSEELRDNGTDARAVFDISALSNLSYYADFGNCPNLTGDISALSNCSRRVWLSNCSGVSGYFVNPHPQMYEIQLDGTAMSPNDTDQTLIALDANTARTNGNMSIVANRTSASDAAYNALIARGWTITEV